MQDEGAETLADQGNGPARKWVLQCNGRTRCQQSLRSGIFANKLAKALFA